MKYQKYIVLVSLLGVIAAQEDDDNDGKYRPDAIPVWEHERQDYSFSYGVRDLHTGDVKNQWEKKVGDTIHGHYTVLEPDGSLRIVHYTADEKNGFNAVVKHEGPSYHPVTNPSNHHIQTHSSYSTSSPIKSKPKTKLPLTHSNTHTLITHHRPHVSHSTKSTKKPKLVEPVEHAQSINIGPESELEAINAYLYIPSQNNQQNNYELISDDRFQHFVNYDDHVPQNHKPVYTALQENSKLKTGNDEEPISYDSLTPVAIDLTQLGLDNYKQGVFVEPQIETGFKPLPKTKTPEKPHIPNTFTTNKKPITTPGLKTYASDQRPHLRGPVVFPKRIDKDKVVQYTGVKSKKNAPRYTKRIAYIPEDY